MKPKILVDAVALLPPLEILEDQKTLIDRGLQRVKQFTWEKSAKEHLAVFKEVLKQ